MANLVQAQSDRVINSEKKTQAACVFFEYTTMQIT